MKKITIYICICLMAISTFAQENPQIFQNAGIYYRDKALTMPYTGDFREYYDNGTIKLEMQIAGGVPEGTYVVYFENRKPQEIRSYKSGKLHGLWRTYDTAGQLNSEAEYKNGEKHGTWRIWDELGTLRYEMIYTNGIKTGVWRIWDETGKLIDERKY